MARVYDSGLFVALPIQALAASVTEVHEFPFHGYTASGADIVTVSIRKEHDLRYWHLYAVVHKKQKELPKHMDDFHFHLLRHAYTTHPLSHRAAPKDVQELLGHSDVNTTMNIYAHATREAKRTFAPFLHKYTTLH